MPERVLVSLWFSPSFIVRPLSPQTLSLLDPQTNSLCDGGIVLVAQMIKDLLAVQETGVQSLGGEDPLEQGMATHCSILAWRIP